MLHPVKAVERFNWAVKAEVRKYAEDLDEYRKLGWTEAEFEAAFKPYEVRESIGNLLLNAGIQRMEDLLIGALTGSTNVFSNGNSRIGVGNSSTAAAATQTDLQASAGSGNRQFVVMDATYPSRSGQVITFQASFTGALGNFAWQEWGIDFTNAAANGTTVGTTMLNRKVESLGTKAAGTWVLQVTITIS